MEEQFLNSIVVNQFRVETISSFDFPTKRSCHFFPHRSSWTIGTTKLASFVSYKIVDLSVISKNACTFESIRSFPFSIIILNIKISSGLVLSYKQELKFVVFLAKEKGQESVRKMSEIRTKSESETSAGQSWRDSG